MSATPATPAMPTRGPVTPRRRRTNVKRPGQRTQRTAALSKREKTPRKRSLVGRAAPAAGGGKK